MSPIRGSSRVSGAPSAGPTQAVPCRKPLEVALVEELDANVRIELPQLAELAVLSRHERLLHDGHLEVQILLRKVEVGCERLHNLPLLVPLEDEGSRLVEPRDAVVVQDLRVLELRLVLEAGGHLTPICLEIQHFRAHHPHRSTLI